MSNVVYDKELTIARAAATAAAAVIERLGPSQKELKADGSPVTAADLAAHEAITEIIKRHFPEDGLLSEEAVDDTTRLDRERVWIIDPLDGTRDFIQNTGEFAVHVALAVKGQAQVAVVIEPASHRHYWAVRGRGAFMSNQAKPLRVSGEVRLERCRVGTSRFALTSNLQAFLEAAPCLQSLTMGASTKLMALARGELEACIWLAGSEKEWDSCAPGLIVEEAGGRMTTARGSAFTYNQPDVVHHHGILATNSRLHGAMLARAQRFLP